MHRNFFLSFASTVPVVFNSAFITVSILENLLDVSKFPDDDLLQTMAPSHSPILRSHLRSGSQHNIYKRPMYSSTPLSTANSYTTSCVHVIRPTDIVPAMAGTQQDQDRSKETAASADQPAATAEKRNACETVPKMEMVYAKTDSRNVQSQSFYHPAISSRNMHPPFRRAVTRQKAAAAKFSSEAEKGWAPTSQIQSPTRPV